MDRQRIVKNRKGSLKDRVRTVKDRIELNFFAAVPGHAEGLNTKQMICRHMHILNILTCL